MHPSPTQYPHGDEPVVAKLRSRSYNVTRFLGLAIIAVTPTFAGTLLDFELTPGSAGSLVGSPIVMPTQVDFVLPSNAMSGFTPDFTPFYISDSAGNEAEISVAELLGGCLMFGTSTANFLGACGEDTAYGPGVLPNGSGLFSLGALPTSDETLSNIPGSWNLSMPNGYDVSVGLYTLNAVVTPTLPTLIQGGSSLAPIELPVGQTTEIAATIGGAALQDYYSFFWEGGAFSATASVVGATTGGSYSLSEGALGACTGSNSSLLDSSNGFSNTVTVGNLPAGQYCVGLATSDTSDPLLTLTFNSAVTGEAAPEPSSLTLLLVAAAAAGLVFRLRRSEN